MAILRKWRTASGSILVVACTDLCTDWTGILADSGCSDCWHLCKRGCGVQLCRSVWDSQYQLRRGNGHIGRHPGAAGFGQLCGLPDDFLPALRSSAVAPLATPRQGIRQHLRWMLFLALFQLVVALSGLGQLLWFIVLDFCCEV